MSCYKHREKYIKASSQKQFKHFGFLCQLKVHGNYLSASEELSQKMLKIMECSKEELVFSLWNSSSKEGV